MLHRVPPPTDLGRAEHYRVKDQNYRASAAVEPDRNRREVFELLAVTFERLAAAYERIKSQAVDAARDSERQKVARTHLSIRSPDR